MNGLRIVLILLIVGVGSGPALGDELPWARKNRKKKPAGGGTTPTATAAAPTASTRAAPDAAAARDAFKMHASGRLEFHARDLSVADALAQLRQLTRRNIVVSPKVNARFTGDLYDVTLQELLEAVSRSAGLRVRTEGSFIYVDPAALETRLFRLHYVRAQEVIAIVEPLVSPEGKLTASIQAQQGIRSSQDGAGGDDYANEEVVLAMDHAENLTRIEEAIKAVDVRPQQVLIEATICAATVDKDRALGVEWAALLGTGFSEVGSVGPDGGSSLVRGLVPSNQIRDGVGSGGTNLLDGIPTTGLNIGILTDHVAGFIRALSEVTDLKVLANPKVMALNKQRGEVIIGRRDGYLTTTVTQTAAIENVEFLETGTRLLFRPYIGRDGYVRLEIHPEDSDGGISGDGLPFKSTTEVTTNIMVKSGDTVVIGGLFRERAQSTRRKVPGVGDVPGAGLLFRSDVDDCRREEIIIMLTPRIVGGPRETDAKAKQVPLGVRRLVDSYLTSAREMIAQGRMVAAASMLDSAADLDPKRPEITGLRAQLEQRRPARPASPAVDRRILDQVCPEVVSFPPPAPPSRPAPTYRPAPPRAPLSTRPAPAYTPAPAPALHTPARAPVGNALDQRILDRLGEPPRSPAAPAPVPKPAPAPAAHSVDQRILERLGAPAHAPRRPAPSLVAPSRDPVQPHRPSASASATPGALPPPLISPKRRGGAR